MFSKIMRKLTRRHITADAMPMPAPQPTRVPVPVVAPPAQSSGLRMQYKIIPADVLRSKIEPHIRQTGKLLDESSMPPAIKEVPENLRNYYDIGNQILQEINKPIAPSVSPPSPSTYAGPADSMLDNYWHKKMVGWLTKEWTPDLLPDEREEKIPPKWRYDPLRSVFARAKNEYEQSVLPKQMTDWLRTNWSPDMTPNVLREIVPGWFYEPYLTIFLQAIKEVQSGIAPSAAPQTTDFPDLPDQDIMQMLQEHGGPKAFEELPPIIGENEHNRDRYYDLGRQMQQQNVPQEQADAMPTSPLAQSFIWNYLDQASEGSEKFHQYLQGRPASDSPEAEGGIGGGMSVGADLTKLDQAFQRIPEGHAGGHKYDPVFGFFAEGPGRKYLSKLLGDKYEQAKILRPPQLANYLATNFGQKLDSAFETLIDRQDVGLFKYIADKFLKMTFDRANAGAGSLIDRETGGVRDMAEQQGVSNQVRNDQPPDPGAVKDSQDMIHAIFQAYPAAVVNLAGKVREMLMKQWGPSSPQTKKGKVLELYLELAQQSLDDVARRYASHDLDEKERKAAEDYGLISMKTPNGQLKWSLNPKMSPAEVMNKLDLSKIVTPSSLVRKLAELAVAERDPAKRKEWMALLGGKNASPMALQEIRRNTEIGQKMLLDAKKRLFMMPQFFLEDIHAPLSEMLMKGETNIDTVMKMLDLLKPHATSKAYAQLMAYNGPIDEARAFIDKQLRTDNSLINRMIQQRKFPPVNLQQLKSMDEKQFRDWGRQVARQLYEDEDDASKRRVADILAGLIDWGQKDQWKGWSEHDKKTHKAYTIIVHGLQKISQLSDVRRRLSKYASVVHVDRSAELIINDMTDRLKEIWKD